MYTELKRLLVGQPLSNLDSHYTTIPKWKALATLSSDALSSVAYATAEILFVLMAFSQVSVAWAIPVSLSIVALLIILTLSYMQTIESYPSGGGAYIVAKDNLGTHAGLVAGAALLIDYVLTVSVSVAAGVENITSAFPIILEHKVLLGACVIFVIMLLNLRGIKESSTIFAFPTYLFVFSILILVAVGIYRYLTLGEIPVATAPTATLTAVPMILLFRAFASGCSALTGVEAISNGVPLFRAPGPKNAILTLIAMSALLGAMFMGVTSLSFMFHALPTEHETLISVLGRTVFGDRTFLYFLLQGSTAGILFLAANTSYADFPRLASLLAKDRFMPRQLASLGDRLVFSNGILGLSIASVILIVMFNGDVSHLIPLYAVGVFLSFTLSQAGMVVHHYRLRQKHWFNSMLINGLGALTTLLVLIDITMTKFLHGAWMVVVMIPALVFVFTRIYKHYIDVGKELSMVGEIPKQLEPIRHTVVIPISGIHRGVIEAVRYASSISPDVRACYVDLDVASTDRMKKEWERWAPHIPLVILPSPYRSVITPLLKYIDDVERTNNDDVVTVVIPEFVTAKPWHQLLHNQTALFIKAALMFQKGKVVTSVRYHLKHT